SAALTSLTRLPSISISPPVTFSSPAMTRSRVDLPQPEGPTKTTSSPSPMWRSIPCSTSTAPKDFWTLVSLIWPICGSLFQSGTGNAGGDEALEEDEHQDDGDHRHHRHGEDEVPLDVQLAGIDAEPHLQGIELPAGKHDQRP